MQLGAGKYLEGVRERAKNDQNILHDFFQKNTTDSTKANKKWDNKCYLLYREYLTWRTGSGKENLSLF